jgi:catechol 2,3-dioxygenase-like lactoylglutathione lyase family enzyme
MARTTHITALSTVVVPVADQDRAIAFYGGELGFETLADFRYADDDRWIEVAPAGAVTSISLAAPRDGRSTGIETGVVLESDDAEADHAALQSRGVDVDPILREGGPVVRWAGTALAGIPAMFLLRDPDRNSLLVVQRS